MKKQILFLILLILLLNDCKTTVSISEISMVLNDRIKEPMIDTKEIPILVITNRNTDGENEECNNKYFKNSPGSVKYIYCFINVPKEHSIGSLDVSNDKIINKNLYFYAIRQKNLEKKDFYDIIKDKKEILIFVHGFNVEFEEAVYRAAQIHYDLKFQGITILYTWPAGPQGGMFSNLMINETYKVNQQYAKISLPVFKSFLQELFNNLSKGTRIYLIVHSMGHQIVIPVLVELANSNQIKNKKIQEIIFNAPDYPIEDFKRDAKVIKNIAHRITIYCSPNDNALKASEVVNKNRRIGQCYKVDGLDVINVKRVDSPILGIGGLGHGYYSSRAILTDLYQLMLGIEVKNRLFITKSDQSSEDYILRD